MSYRDNPDGWMGIFPTPKNTLDDLKLSASPLVIVAESVEKPGNLGAILRTADAAHVDAVIVCDPRVDLWNPNVIRASRGAVFAVDEGILQVARYQAPDPLKFFFQKRALEVSTQQTLDLILPEFKKLMRPCHCAGP